MNVKVSSTEIYGEDFHELSNEDDENRYSLEYIYRKHI